MTDREANLKYELDQLLASLKSAQEHIDQVHLALKRGTPIAIASDNLMTASQVRGSIAWACQRVADATRRANAIVSLMAQVSESTDQGDQDDTDSAYPPGVAVD